MELNPTTIETQQLTPQIESLLLNKIAIDNPYAEYAVNLYQQCLTDLSQSADQATTQEHSLEDISSVMIELSLATDEPELAAYYLSQIDDWSTKIDLYFKTFPNLNSNAAEKKTHELLEDIPEQLELYPKLLCQFMIREIKDLGSMEWVDVPRDAAMVMNMSRDQEIFAEPWYSSDLLAETAVGVRYDLSIALLKQGHYELAEKVMDEVPNIAIRQKRNGMGFYSNDMFGYEKSLAQAQRGDLSRRDLQRLEGYAVYGLNHWHARNSYSALSLALGPKPDKKWLAYAQEHPWKFLWDELPLDFRGIYQNMFPTNTAKHWAEINIDEEWRDTPEDKVQRIASLARAGWHELADKKMVQIMEEGNLHQSSVVKLKAASIMAGAFNELPNDQFELEAQISAAVEMLEFELSHAPRSNVGVSEKSEDSQHINKVLEGLLVKIEDLNREAIKIEQYMQLLEVVKDSEVINKRLKQAMHFRIHTTEFNKHNFFKRIHPHEMSNFYFGEFDQHDPIHLSLSEKV